jgi:phosphonate transport system substrate-binding protein
VNMKNKIITLVGLLFLVASCGKKVEATKTSESTPAVFKFTAIPDNDSTKLKERFGALAQYLEKKLGVKVEYVPVKDYPASVLAFKNGDVQLAWFGGLSGVQARAGVKDSNAIAQGVEDPIFKTYFIANSSTGLEVGKDFPEKLKGLSFTFGSKDSTSGRLMPEFYIRKASKMGPDEFFSKVGFSGDHSKTLALVQDGAFQAGALNYKTWETAVADGKVDTSKVKLIWETPTYPDYNWSIRGDVDKTFGEGFTNKVQQAIVDLDDAVLLKNLERSKFIKADNAMYAPIEETAKAIGILD